MTTKTLMSYSLVERIDYDTENRVGNGERRMSTTHTPGPWRWRRNRRIDTRFEVEAELALSIASVNNRKTKGIREAEANAQLIAAAPDLLAALKAALNAIETSELDDWATFNDLAIAAIKKAQAQGEQR